MRRGVVIALLGIVMAFPAERESRAAGADADIRLPLLSEARLRTAANFSSPALAVLPAGTIVEVLSRDGPYFQVAAADTVGFVVFASLPRDSRLTTVPAARREGEIADAAGGATRDAAGPGAVSGGVLDRDPGGARPSRDGAGAVDDAAAAEIAQPAPELRPPPALAEPVDVPAPAEPHDARELAAPVDALAPAEPIDAPARPEPVDAPVPAEPIDATARPEPVSTDAPALTPTAPGDADFPAARARATTATATPVTQVLADEASTAFAVIDTSWTVADRAAELLAQYGEPAASRILRGDVWLGMTAGMARDARGEPERVHRTVTSDITHEMWIYDAIYLYLDNGVVIGWQESAGPAD